MMPAKCQTWAECWACRCEQGKGCPQVAQRLPNYQLAKGVKEQEGNPFSSTSAGGGLPALLVLMTGSIGIHCSQLMMADRFK